MLAIVNLKISLCSSTLIFFMQHLSSTGLISLTCAYSRTQAISNFTFACLFFFLSFDRTILSSFTKEQMSRYEAFRRSAIPKTEIKKVSTLAPTVLFWLLLMRRDHLTMVLLTILIMIFSKK